MEKHVLSDQTGFLSGQNLFLAGQMDLPTDKIICRLEYTFLIMIHEDTLAITSLL